MRKLLIAIGLLAAAGLTGCNNNDSQPAPPKPASTSCNCTIPVQPAAAAPAARQQHVATTRHRWHHRHMAGYAYGHRWHKRYAERAVDIYNYSSASHGTDTYHHDFHGADHAEGQYGDTTRVWADGYGRRHIYDESAVAHYVYQARERVAQSRTRFDPWHGYDDDWDN